MSNVANKREAVLRKTTNTKSRLRAPQPVKVVVMSESEDDSYGENMDSEEEEDMEFSPRLNEQRLNRFAFYLNVFLLLLPTSINIIVRSIADAEFRSVAIAWAVIMPFTSDISIDEGVVPALVASSLGFDNNVVRRNMYISIARSRLGLFALAALSFYLGDFHILLCGMLLRLLVQFSAHILQNSIPKMEITLICGVLVNMLYHFVQHAHLADCTDPTGIIASGLAAALPCYPLFVRFVTKFRLSHGRSTEWGLAIAIYVLYLTVAVYLYFFLFGSSIHKLLEELANNSALVMYWTAALTVASSAAILLGPYIGLDGRRKLWHLCTVVMFLPPWVRERPFTRVALGATLVLFIALETARATVLPPFGKPIHKMLQTFVDHRDQRGPVVISHIYLLLGISVPIFLANSPAGVICLGLGDTLASQIGRRLGRRRIFGHKSLEGCIAFAIAAAVALYYAHPEPSSFVLTVVIPAALLEAVTPVNDNLIVPMYMLSLQGLLRKLD